MTYVEVRCSNIVPSGQRCGKLLLEVASSASGELRCKCTRCKALTVALSSEAGRRRAIR